LIRRQPSAASVARWTWRARIFPAPFIPLLVAAPALGTLHDFRSTLRAVWNRQRGAIHRLDRHPSISKHPVTPMTEADLRAHLAKQTQKRIALFDILKVAAPAKKARVPFETIVGRPNRKWFCSMRSAR
jgi:3-oxoisoapionate kinase